MALTKQAILDALASVTVPDNGKSIIQADMVSDIVLDGGRVIFSLTVPAAKAKEFEPLRQQAHDCVMAIDGVSSVMVALTAERTPGQGGAQSPAPGSAPPNGAGGSGLQSRGQLPEKKPVPGIRHIVAVASGKGGVGKSTTSVNVALGLAEQGLKVGILDADIYGPSMARLLGITGKPEAKDDKTIIPMKAYGLKVMSMSFLVGEDTPVIWRGPMVITALTQMLRDVEWENLDVLVVDMPPGTGDAQLTMAQQVPLSGAVIVSTPQDLALIDARKGINMFKKVEIPILGIVENMSQFICPNCGHESHIFGHGGAKAEAEKMGANFLGEIPLDMEIRKNSDDGKPIVVAMPDSPHAQAYGRIAQQIAAQLAL